VAIANFINCIVFVGTFISALLRQMEKTAKNLNDQNRKSIEKNECMSIVENSTLLISTAHVEK
jgi:hypothetical protein